MVCVLDGAFFGAASQLRHPRWASGALLIAAFVVTGTSVLAVFLLQTVFREKLLTDEHVMQLAIAKNQAFHGFEPVDAETYPGAPEDDPRATIYQQNRGLFLVHSWRPSLDDKHKDVVIRLFQHRDGPLNHELVRSSSTTSGRASRTGKSRSRVGETASALT